MCTLILGRDVVSPGSLLLAANRDEDPGRPSDPPALLHDRPRLVGGRDRRAGGTWLAVRDARAVVAILNRRDRSGGPAPPDPDRRSRGALVMDVAAGPADHPEGMAAAAMAAASRSRYAPCTLVFGSPAACWHMAIDAEAPPRVAPVPPGWHVLTHADLDDPSEPRTARLMRELAGFAPRSLAEAEERLDDLLRSHGDPAAGVPPVCLHTGRMVTVSSSRVWLATGATRYHHAEGHPCEHPLLDRSSLLGAGAPVPGRT